MLNEKYDPKDLEKGIDTLKDQDQAIAKYLDMANKSLPAEEQYSIYVVKYARCFGEEGRERGGHFYRKFQICFRLSYGICSTTNPSNFAKLCVSIPLNCAYYCYESFSSRNIQNIEY